MAGTTSVSIGRRQFDRSSGRCEGECRLRRLSLTNGRTSRFDESATVGEPDGERGRSPVRPRVGRQALSISPRGRRTRVRTWWSPNRAVICHLDRRDRSPRICSRSIMNRRDRRPRNREPAKVARKCSSSRGSRRRDIPDRVAATCHLLELIFASVAPRKVCDKVFVPREISKCCSCCRGITDLDGGRQKLEKSIFSFRVPLIENLYLNTYV